MHPLYVSLNLERGLSVLPDVSTAAVGEEMRPVRLRTLVRSYAPAKNDYLFEKRLDTFLPGVISETSGGKPTLVFCRSVVRNDAGKIGTAEYGSEKVG